MTLTYDSLMILPLWSSYNVTNFENRLIIITKTSSKQVLAGVTSYNLNYGIYAMVDTTSGVQMVEAVYFNITSMTVDIPIILSPNLTKIYYQYTLLNTNTPINVIKTIDYQLFSINDVNITNLNILSSCSITLGDTYLVARNDTPQNIAASSTNPTLQFY